MTARRELTERYPVMAPCVHPDPRKDEERCRKVLRAMNELERLTEERAAGTAAKAA